MPTEYIKAEDRRDHAYSKLGVNREACESGPKISHLLSKVPGGINSALDALRISDSPEATRFFKFFDDPRIPIADRNVLPIEAYCMAAGVSPLRIFGLMSEACVTVGLFMGNMMRALGHETLTQASLNAATDPVNGFQDRKLNYEAIGALPKGKGISIKVNSDNKQQNNVVTLPSPETTVRELEDRFNESPKLSAPSERLLPEKTPEYIEVEGFDQ